MRIGKLILPLLSSEGHPLADQHRDVAEALLARFGQFITVRAMCITRTAVGPGSRSTDSAEHVATYEPTTVTTDEDWAALNAIGESFKVAVAKVNDAEAAELAQELARAASERDAQETDHAFRVVEPDTHEAEHNEDLVRAEQARPA